MLSKLTYRVSGLGFVLAASIGVAGCNAATDAPTEQVEVVDTDQAALAAEAGTAFDVTRSVIEGDVVRYTFTIRVGEAPNALLRISRVVAERRPLRPRSSDAAIMLLHGDFATFESNFAPAPSGVRPPEGGLAVYLAKRGIDVWGVDRRWTTAPTEGADVSDFGAMTFAQELTDIGHALAFARLTRGATGSGVGRILLGGFSRGGQLAYEYAAKETQKPGLRRHVSGLVPIDVYAKIAPDDDTFRQNACANYEYERDALAGGAVDSDNGFVIQVGALAGSAPNDPSPFFPDLTNQGAILAFIGQTYLFFQPTPFYHLGGIVTKEGVPTSFRFMTQPVVERWLTSAPFHQAIAESADGDAIWCGVEPRPLEDHLADIAVPLYYLGAAGGFGDHGLYSTTLVASTDVTTHVVRRLDAANEAEDFGHGDLLFGDDAPALAWRPLARWIQAH